ncbi:bifunctional heptose 7-phosphate kinase/heptose 1-phosphate adenyltransferase [Leptolyngbya sp. FACHB-261]|uniref:bifunctional heptose 7-phosphate kinase/heptose 1-phosphate adenyltransferase n=1 Tax=Leptolyngbya sp. FACHB-261 TaxID=2692806 RepID=UPI0016850755|nr:PfkB family carbohydrate kinase [Leptolyngbya sp. FACHB-261]MBD2103280.1 bifunctional hydroxymethylpyrimidine kinase/phosphomethylpyrimidine kinase [Leptolyngbya sp. FACHB-261]
MTDFQQLLRSDAAALSALIDGFRGHRVLAVGDLTLDEFLTGEVERPSREAPVLVIRHEQTRQIPGGGANAIYNLAKLGAQVTAVGLVGSDDQGKALRRIFQEAGIDTAGILVDPHRPTVTKTRISAHARQSVTQQVVRVDRKSDDPADPELQRQLAEFIAAHINEAEAVVCSDYGDGVLSSPVIQAALQHSRVIVDAQTGLGRFVGATIFTPNLPEAELAIGYGIHNTTDLKRAAEDLLNLTQAQYMLITRGEQGMSLFGRKSSQYDIPAFNRTDVFDVTGAGDTVVAGLTLGLCAGGSFEQASVLGNLAASLVVRQFGTATTSVAEMRAALEQLVSVREGQ